MVSFWYLVWAWAANLIIAACFGWLASTNRKLRGVVDAQRDQLNEQQGMVKRASKTFARMDPEMRGQAMAIYRQVVYEEMAAKLAALDATGDDERQRDDGQHDEDGEEGGVHG